MLHVHDIGPVTSLVIGGLGRSHRQLDSHALCSVVSGVRVDVSRPSGACVRASCPTLFLRP